MAREIPRRLVACLLNISEARNKHLVEEVALSSLKATHPPPSAGYNEFPRSAVLNIFSDWDYNRSVITIVAPAQHIGQSVLNACLKACESIDLSLHHGGHPRLGAVDLVPIHPLSAEVSLEECGDIARDIAEELTERMPGSSVFLFGYADRPAARGLVRRRKDVHWYSGKHGSDYAVCRQDMGSQPTARYGLTGIGAIPYVMNCNVTIDTTDLEFGQKIAKSIRASTPGGLPGVQSMAFPNQGRIEIACNVQSLIIDKQKNDKNYDLSQMLCSFGDSFYVPGHVIENRVALLAKEKDVDIHGTSIIGFTPEGAHELAITALQSGQSQFWRTRSTVMM